MKAAIIINGYSETDGAAYQVKRLTEEFAMLRINAKTYKNNELTAYIKNGGIRTKIDADFVVYLDKDIHIAMQLEKAGFKLFNSRESIELCDDKIKTHIALADNGIPMPDTVASPLMYSIAKDDFLSEITSVLKLPIVVKEAHGSLGGQVYLAKSIEELSLLRERLKFVPHLYQEYIEESSGKDCRVIVIGGKAKAAYLRVSKNDFRSNIELGGIGEKFDLPEEFKMLAEKISKLLKLDYCGIDLLFKGNKPVLCEVNSNAFFTGAEKYTGVNVAKLYCEYMANEMKKIVK